MTDTTAHDRPRGYAPPPIAVPPLFERRPRPLAMVRWWITRFMWPQSLAWIAVSVVAWNLLTPDGWKSGRIEIGWVTGIYLRNVALMVAVIGGLHLHLHIRRAQGTRFKYDPRWLATDRSTFLFGNQTRDNVFWTLVGGGAIATGYESAMLWLYANDRIPETSWSAAPAYLAFMTCALFIVEGVHFYANHRLLHWDPLYRLAHSLHHKNVNTGPWSGISMHPLEHLLYFSLPLVFLVVPGSPFLVAFSLIYLMLSPSPSHSGFDRFELPGGGTLHGGDHFHNLHHRYFECNYGMLALPIDRWVGTFHDGSPEAHERMRHRRRAARR